MVDNGLLQDTKVRCPIPMPKLSAIFYISSTGSLLADQASIIQQLDNSATMMDIRMQPLAYEEDSKAYLDVIRDHLGQPSLSMARYTLDSTCAIYYFREYGNAGTHAAYKLRNLHNSVVKQTQTVLSTTQFFSSSQIRTFDFLATSIGRPYPIFL